jgi:putative oxidoreductase
MASSSRSIRSQEAGQASALAGLDPAWGITAVRIAMGAILVVSGFQKLTNLAGVVGFFGSIGLPAPGVLAPLVALMELLGGILVLIGLRPRWIAVWFVGEFLVTFLYVKLVRGAGWDAARIDLLMLVGAILLILAGAGQASVDGLRSRRDE